MVGNEIHKGSSAEKLRLLKSPVVGGDDDSVKEKPTVASAEEEDVPNLRGTGDRLGPCQDTPALARHEDASNLELFFDLFFAANYTVFSQTQSATSPQRFEAYIGYFSLLWMTWLVTGLYDVRFLTDSIFERLAKGVHLGVMVGFAVVSANFDPHNQDRQTMQTMSLILMTSRLSLMVEYGSVLWHVRKFKKSRLPLYLQIAINFAAAMVYLGITFRFRHYNSHVYITWYIISVLEVTLTMLMSNVWSILSLTKTHLMRRMALLTIIILGDGIIVVAENVVTIVENPDAWNPLVIGIVTAATATIYMVFLVYFDWMKHLYLPSWRQQAWTCLHFPFHLALVLFMQGFTQFIIWTKVIDILKNLTLQSVLDNFDAVANSNSVEIQNSLRKLATDFFALYPLKYYDTWDTVQTAIANVTEIPDDFWPQIVKWEELGEDMAYFPPRDQALLFSKILLAVVSSMTNALFETFKIDLYDELLEDEPNTSPDADGAFQTDIQKKTWERYMLVFAYAYIASGVTLVLLTILTAISHTKPWKAWHFVRVAVNIALALGMGCTAILYYNEIHAMEFLFSAWVLPAITIIWLIVLALTHIHHPPPLFFRGNAAAAAAAAARDDERHEYDRVAAHAADHVAIPRKPVGGEDGWDVYRRRTSSTLGRAGPGDGAYPYGDRLPYGDSRAGYGAVSHDARETAYDSYQSDMHSGPGLGLHVDGRLNRESSK